MVAFAWLTDCRVGPRADERIHIQRFLAKGDGRIGTGMGLAARSGRPRANGATACIPSVAAGVWSAATGGNVVELNAALKHGPQDAAKLNAMGVFLPEPNEAAGCFARTLALAPKHAVAGMNRAEALIRAGRNEEANIQAHDTLALLEKPGDLCEAAFDAPHYPPGFDVFGVEWERAGWSNAGDPSAEIEAKRTLLRCWLHSILADLTGNLNHFMSAARARPDLPTIQAALGCAMARKQQEHPFAERKATTEHSFAERKATMDEALRSAEAHSFAERKATMAEAAPLLRNAVAANPFDRMAARALYQILSDMRDWPAPRGVCARAARSAQGSTGLAPLEDWFKTVPLAGTERTSIIVLACNQVEFTRLCLESILRHTTRRL